MGVRVSDLDAMATLPGVNAVYGMNYTGRRLVSSPRDQRVVPVDGVDAGYFAYRNWPIVRGREFAALDIMNASRVTVVGAELVPDLFGDAEPVGRTLTIEGIRFRVIGVVAPIELELIPADFSFLARRVYIPYSYVTKYDRGQQRVDGMIVRVADTTDFATAMAEGEALLRRRHRGATDFEIDNEAADLAEELAMADGIMHGWNIVLYTIAGVTLIVGGVGLFSVLLISVRERVREIGIRMALGADGRAIRWLFLVESLTLAALGALLGVGGGAGLIVVTETIAQNFGKEFTIPIHLPGAVAAIAFALVVGLLFGWYPARRAARLNPIEAIREL